MIITRIRQVMLEDPKIVLDLDQRIYPVEWPDAPTFPLAVLQRAGGIGLTDMKGEAGIEHARVQIDVYTDTGYTDLTRMVSNIRRRFNGFKGGPKDAPCAIDRCAVINMMDLPANEVKQAGPRLRRRCLELSVWSKEI